MVKDNEYDDSEAPYDEQALWRLIQALERAAWGRKWSEVKQARKALEQVLGKRPHDPLFQPRLDKPLASA